MSTVLRNAKIYTSDKDSPLAEAIVMEGDTIKYVGPDDKAAWSAVAGTDAEVHDLNGRMIIPGIVDGHIHPGMCSKSVWHVKLPWTEDKDELLAFIKDYGLKHPKEEAPFLYFEYYPTCMFDTDGPKKEWLDDVISDRPVLCQDFGEHLCWVNSKMLELLGVDKDTPDPTTLEVFVRYEDGTPTGWVKEMAWLHFAENLFSAINWIPPETLTEETLTPFFDFLKSKGITAMADGFIENDDQMKAIYEMDKAGRLHTYYDGFVRFWTLEDLPEKIEKVKEYQKLYTTDHIKVNTMKLFLDGTNESGNSASLHEHINDPGNYGEIMMEMEELRDCFLLCNKEGLDIHIHIVGDRGFRTACDAVEAAQKIAASEGQPWICQPVFAHCEVVDPSDMGRPAELGITINWSCHWSGGYFGEEAMNYYTEEKWRRMYQFNPIIESGALVTFSSDVVTNYELHRADPFFSMQVAATRIDPEFPLDPDKYPESMRPPASAKLARNILLQGYTIGAAKQLRWDNILGSLEVGKKANLNIISDGFFEVPDDKIKDINWDAVFFDGKLVYGNL